MDARAERQARMDAQRARARDRHVRGRNTEGLVRMRRWRRAVGRWLVQLLVPIVLRALAATWRVQRLGTTGRERFFGTGPFLVAMWHGRMLVLMPVRGHRGRRLQVLVSPSDDGELAQRALHHFGYRVVRGSLSRGGARALRTMREQLDLGSGLVITPDGPRGPRHGMNVGIAWLARATGAPILPLGVAVDRAWRLRSWDRFTIPKPFARLRVVHGEPIAVAADASDGELERIAASVRDALLACERSGYAALGVADDLEAPRAVDGTEQAGSGTASDRSGDASP